MFVFQWYAVHHSACMMQASLGSFFKAKCNSFFPLQFEKEEEKALLVQIFSRTSVPKRFFHFCLTSFSTIKKKERNGLKDIYGYNTFKLP